MNCGPNSVRPRPFRCRISFGTVTAPGPAGNDGFALIVVLWFLVLLSAIGIYMMANGRSETALAHNLLAGARAEALADAAVAQVVFNETDPDPRNHWRLDGKPRVLNLPGGNVTVNLFDETLKINPNLASDTLMAALFQSVGVESGKAASLGAAVADWVGPANKPHPGGAEKEQYAQAGKTCGPPNAPMETLDDLQLVLGMTPQIFAAARPYLTVFTDTDAPVDPRLAAVPVALAIALAARSSGDDAADQSAAAGGTAPATGVAGQAQAGSNTAQDTPTVVIALEAMARSADGGVFSRHAVIKLDTEKPKGYDVLDWRRNDLSQ